MMVVALPGTPTLIMTAELGKVIAWTPLPSCC